MNFYGGKKTWKRINRQRRTFLSQPSGQRRNVLRLWLDRGKGSKGKLIGILMVDRPGPADPEWLKQVERNFGEYQLVPMTATGERGIVCRMQIVAESLTHLRQYPTEKAETLKKALEPLLDNRPHPVFVLSWNEDHNLWQSKMTNG